MSEKIKTMKEIMEEAKLPLDISHLPIRTYLDIPYATGKEDTAHRLDIALPAEGKGPFPVVVFFHGGGFYYGDKRNLHTVAPWSYIPVENFALVSVNYRLTTEAPWPAQIYDCKAAIRFIRAHADEYQLDGDRIGVWGNSAGGQLSAVIATTGGMPEFEDLTMGNPDVSSTVQAACVWYGIYDLLHFDQQWQRILKPGEAPEKEDYDALGALIDNPAYPSKEDVAVFASASSHVHSQMPPMLLFHGTADRVVPYLQTVEFFEKYIQANDHAKIHMEIIENAPHGGPAFINEANMDQVKRFFLRWLKEN